MEASVELVLVVVVVAAAAEVLAGLVGLVEAFPVVVAAVVVVVAVVVVAAAVAAGMDSCSPADDNIQPTGPCSPAVQQWLLL